MANLFNAMLLYPSTSRTGTFWVAGGTGNTNSTTNWSLTDGGASGAAVPIAGVNANWTGNSGSGTSTINASFVCKDFNLTGFTGTLAGSSSVNCGGSYILGSGMTRSNTGVVTMSSTTTGKVFTVSGKTLGGNVTFNGNGGGWTITENITTTGNISTTNGSPNFTGRTITCATWSVTASGTPIVSGLNVNNSTNFTGGSLAYNNVVTTVTIASAVLSGSNSFANYTLSNTTSYGTETVTAATTQTISGAYVVSGANTVTQRALQKSTSSGVAANIIVNGTASITNTDLIDIHYTGSATPISAPGVGDGGGNTGVTFDAPRSAYWVHPATASQTLQQANFYTTSGGATPITPLIHDNLIFDANSFPSSGKTIALSVQSGRYGSLNFTGATNTPTLNVTNGTQSFVYGSLTLISGMTLSGGGTLVMAGDKAFTLTTGTKTLSFGLAIVCSSPGSVTLQDDLASTAGLTVQSGTFDFNNKTASGLVTFTVSTGAEAYLGNQTLVLAQEGTVFSAFTGAIIHPGTSVIKFTLAAAGVGGVTFTGGGNSGYSVWNATTGTGYAIIGDTGNTFTQIKVDASRNQRFTAGTSNDVAALVLGVSCTLQSTTASQATINNTSGIAFTGVGTTVTNMNVTGAGLIVTGGVNGGGNTGVTFI